MIAVWIGLAVIYGILVLISKDYKFARAKRQEREDRRIQQNREWHGQFNQLSPSIRAAIRMMREDQRREHATFVALLAHCNHTKSRKDKLKVDWKKEGF